MKSRKMLFVVLVFGLLIGGNEALAMNAYTRGGPDIVGNRYGLNLIHPGHNNQYLWSAQYDGDLWTHFGRVHNHATPRSWPMTYSSPESILYYGSGGVRWSRGRVLSVFRGHNNNRVWYASTVGNWCYTPRYIPGAFSDFSPSVTWANRRIVDSSLFPYTPWVTVAYTKTDERIAIQYGKECLGIGEFDSRVCGTSHLDASDWEEPVEIRADIAADSGPKIESFQGRVYVFYRSAGGGDAIYYTRNRDLYEADSFIRPIRLPNAYTRYSRWERPVDTIVHDGKLIVAFVGHNNDRIFLVQTENGTDWESLGYIPHVRTRYTPSLGRYLPDLSTSSDDLYLAFKEYSDTTSTQNEHQETCVGTLTIRERNNHHWDSIRIDKTGIKCTVDDP